MLVSTYEPTRCYNQEQQRLHGLPPSSWGEDIRKSLSFCRTQFSSYNYEAKWRLPLIVSPTRNILERSTFSLVRREENKVVKDHTCRTYIPVIIIFTIILSSVIGRAIAQAVICWLLTTEARVSSESSICGTCQQSDTETDFPLIPSVFYCQYHYTCAPHSLMCHMSDTERVR
jgi:hypothetical protein